MSVLGTIFGFVSNVVQPVVDLVDNLHTSEEEKLTLRNQLLNLQAGLQIKMMEYEAKLVENRAKIITAEATGQSWLQRNWRPITMMTFLFLVVMDSFGFLPFRLAEDAWTLLKIGLGGYVVGRSAEKIVPKLTRGKDE